MPGYIFSIIMVITLYLVHLSISKSESYNRFFIKRFGEKSGQARTILLNRIIGAVLFGFIPVTIATNLFGMHSSSLGLSLTTNKIGLFSMLCFGTIAIIVNFFAAQKPDNLAQYPQIRILKWDYNLLILSSLTWLIYLIGYEILYRGFLFNICHIELGLLPAIFINMAVYSITHIAKGYKEAIGALPMGLVLCLATYFSGSVIAAIVIHASLTLSNEWFSIKYNKQIKIAK